MLRPFPIPVTIEGRRWALIARDVAVAEFFYGFPEEAPLSGAWTRNLACEQWVDALLVRAVVRPRLSLELVHRLGASRDEAALAYLAMIGWAEDEPAPTARFDTPVLVPASLEEDLAATVAEALRPFVTLPAAPVIEQLCQMAEAAHILPSALWTMPISEWNFSCRLLRQAERQRRDRGEGR